MLGEKIGGISGKVTAQRYPIVPLEQGRRAFRIPGRRRRQYALRLLGMEVTSSAHSDIRPWLQPQMPAPEVLASSTCNALGKIIPPSALASS